MSLRPGSLGVYAEEQKKLGRKTNSKTVKRVILIFRPYKWQVIAIVLIILATTLLNLVIPLSLPYVFDDAIPHRNMTHLLFYALIMSSAAILAGLLSIVQTYLNSFVGQRVMCDLRNRLYAHLQDMPFRFFTSTRVGEIQSRLSNDIGGAQNTVTEIFVVAISYFIITVANIAAMIYLSPLLTLITFILLPFFLWMTNRVGKIRRKLSSSTQENLASLHATMQETLSVSGILLIKTFGRKEFAKQRFAEQNEQLAKVAMNQQRTGRRFFALVDTFMNLSPILIYVVAGWLIIYQIHAVSISMGALIAFMLLQDRFFTPFTKLLSLHVDLQGSLALFDRIFEYLDMPIEIIDAPNAIRLSPNQVRGEVVFKDVSFNYQHKDMKTYDHIEANAKDTNNEDVKTPLSSDKTQTLEHISFHIKPGQLVALVGPSGAGKTTLTYLLSRLYDTDSGFIEIDGYNIKDLALDSLSQIISVVTQEAYLFHTTVRENLLYVRPEASEEDLIAATKAAAIHDRVMELENGYDTLVGERGYRLSGGEKQRLAIARVFLKNPCILILDEATSSLDTNSERLIQSALEPLIKNHTTIAIAHRLSTIRAADLILVLDRGRIAERGTHEELLNRGALYADLCKKQFMHQDDDDTLKLVSLKRDKNTHVV